MIVARFASASPTVNHPPVNGLFAPGGPNAHAGAVGECVCRTAPLAEEELSAPRSPSE